MQFFVMGGTGFIGVPLIRRLLKEGHEVTALARTTANVEDLPPGTNAEIGDPLTPGDWQEIAARADVIINLVGRPIMTRWTTDARKAIMDTRVLSTRMAVEAIPRERASHMALINGNAVGYYEGAGDAFITEESPHGKGFLAEVAIRWQEEAEVAKAKGARVVIARLGAVFGRGGGALAQMLPPFRLGVGGRLGSGRQWFSWIHMDDLTRALSFLAERGDISGVVNVCSPNPVTNLELTKTLATVLGRPAILPIPGFVLKMVLGGVAEIALAGERVIPNVLEKKGFAFEFPALEEALRDLLGS